jgi:hypothetical protein
MCRFVEMKSMKGVTFLKDEKTNKQILQIDVREVAKNPSKFEDLMDVIIAEARKDEKKVSWETAKKQLKKAGKL